MLRRCANLNFVSLIQFKGCEVLPEEEAKYYSEECQEFLRKLTELDPAKRPHAKALQKVFSSVTTLTLLEQVDYKI